MFIPSHRLRLAPILTILLWIGAAQYGSLLAQPLASPGRPGLPTGVHLSAQVGLGYYGGDLDAAHSGRDLWDSALAAEVAWHPSPFVGVALAARRGAFPRLADGDDEVRNLGIGYGVLRLSPTTGRFTPYAQLGLHRTFGGNDTGYGPTGGLGLVVSVGRAVHLFAETTMFFVVPDDALDGTATGSSFDQLGFVGLGLRLANPGVRYPRRVTLEDVQGPRTVTAGDQATFRALVNRRSSEPVVFRWTLDDGRTADGAEASFSFDREGSHTVTLVVENAAGYDATTFDVLALPAEAPRARAEPRVDEPRPGDRTREEQPRTDRRENPPPAESGAPADRTPPRAGTPEEAGARDRALPTDETATDRNRSGPTSGRTDEEREPTAQRRSGPDATNRLGAIRRRNAPHQAATSERSASESRRAAASYAWVVGSYADAETAEEAARRLRTIAGSVDVQRAVTAGGVRYRLVSGRYHTRSGALGNRPPAPRDAWLIRVEESADAQPPASIGEESLNAPSHPYYAWAIASLRNEVDAREIADTYGRRGYEVAVQPAIVGGATYYRVLAGHFSTRKEAAENRSVVIPADAPADSWIVYVESPNVRAR